VIAELESAQQFLDATPDRHSVATNFETLDEGMAKSPLIGGPWRRFSATLLIPILPSRPIHQTVTAERFFNSSSLFQA